MKFVALFLTLMLPLTAFSQDAQLSVYKNGKVAYTLPISTMGECVKIISKNNYQVGDVYFLVCKDVRKDGNSSDI